MVTKHNMAAKSENYSHILPPLSTKREQYKAFRKMKLSKLTDVNTYCRCALKTTPTVNRTIEHFSQVRQKDTVCTDVNFTSNTMSRC